MGQIQDLHLSSLRLQTQHLLQLQPELLGQVREVQRRRKVPRLLVQTRIRSQGLQQLIGLGVGQQARQVEQILLLRDRLVQLEPQHQHGQRNQLGQALLQERGLLQQERLNRQGLNQQGLRHHHVVLLLREQVHRVLKERVHLEVLQQGAHRLQEQVRRRELLVQVGVQPHRGQVPLGRLVLLEVQQRGVHLRQEQVVRQVDRQAHLDQVHLLEALLHHVVHHQVVPQDQHNVQEVGLDNFLTININRIL